MKVVFVLANPENPDNVGASARAMKNMGFNELRLVKPPRAWKRKGKKLAMSAYDVLESAKVHKTLAAAIRDCQVVIGTTRRLGAKRVSQEKSFNVTVKAIEKSRKAKVAIVFGKESKGMTNDELALCDWLTTIPTDTQYPSINLSQAVLIFAFSLAKGTNANKVAKRTVEPNFANVDYVTKKEVEELILQFKGSLRSLGYHRLRGNVMERIEKTFRSMLKRQGLLTREMQMLKGYTRRIREMKPGE